MTDIQVNVSEKTSDTTKRILIVEDDEISKDVMILFLKGLYSVDAVSSAKEAIEIVDKNQYSLILMDINLGRGMTGIDLTKLIKQKPNFENVPIVAITAFAMRGDKEEFMASGFDHYLAKPFTREELKAIIRKFIKNS
jgi:CheY-like chemotaxis protein